MPAATRTQSKKALSTADMLMYAAEAELCRRSFKAFVKAAWLVLEPGTELKWNWHMDALCEHLQACVEGKIQRLVINIAPGHTKSTIVSQSFPAWVWTRRPETRMLCASTDLSLAIRDNRNCRMLIESEWYRACYGREFHLNDTCYDMSADQNMKSYFANDRAGYRQALSVCGKGIGKRGDLLIIDDPHDPREGDVDREKVIEWYRQTWVGRLNDQAKGVMITIGQRIHDEDLCGHILRQGGAEHLCLPEEFDPARRCVTSIGYCDPRDEAGELLWEAKFPKLVVEKLKDDLGSFGYAAQWDQAPVPVTGGTFKKEWARYFEIEGDYYILHTKQGRRKPVPIRACRNEAVCDLATSEKEQSDFFVIETWAITPENECLLLDQVRGHFNNPDQQKEAIKLYEQYAWMVFWVEQVAYQLAYIQQMRYYEVKEEIEKDVYRVVRTVSVPVMPWKPFRDKVARAGTAAVKMEAGDMYWLAGAHYLLELTKEIFTFPKSKKKDQVDCHSMIADILSAPRGPMMWSVDGGESVATEAAPGTVQRVASVFEDDGEDELGGTLYDAEVEPW
jgi:predicted phage terminase large subunit-like protein